MKAKLKEWSDAGYDFKLDWLLRSVNTVLTDEAKFQFLHGRTAEGVQDGLKRATKHIDHCINMIGARLGLDHNRAFFGRFAIPVMVRYLDQRGGRMGAKEQDKLLFWFMQAGMWGRFSGSIETYIDRDLAVLKDSEGKLDKLLEELRVWRGDLRVVADNFTGWSLGARFYPVLYFLTRMGKALDWGKGIELKTTLLGKGNQLEVHHIFPKARLYKHKLSFKQPEVNALANFCFLTKDTNLSISDRLPEEYFPEVEKAHPGALASQWTPDDSTLWKIENFRDFLEARKALLAEETNRRMGELLHGETHWLEGTPVAMPTQTSMIVSIASEEEEQQVEALNSWIEQKGLSPGILTYDFPDPETGQQRAVFDLAWPSGIQEELSSPVAVLINAGEEVIAAASQAGYRCFVSIDSFKRYVENDLLKQEETI